MVTGGEGFAGPLPTRLEKKLKMKSDMPRSIGKQSGDPGVSPGEDKEGYGEKDLNTRQGVFTAHELTASTNRPSFAAAKLGKVSVGQMLQQYQPRAALTGKHDTLVRRAPGWQGAPDGQQAKKLVVTKCLFYIINVLI